MMKIYTVVFLEDESLRVKCFTDSVTAHTYFDETTDIRARIDGHEVDLPTSAPAPSDPESDVVQRSAAIELDDCSKLTRQNEAMRALIREVI